MPRSSDAGAGDPAPPAPGGPWPYFPVFLRLRGERVLVVGGGEVALRKIRLLGRSEARIEVVARSLHRELAELVAAGTVDHRGGTFEPERLAGCRLVIAATDDGALNAQVAAEAGRRSIPVNVVDDARLSTWVTPSVVDRSPLLVAVSSSGASPVAARHVRAMIERLLPGRYSRLAAFLGRMRGKLKRLAVGPRRRALEAFLDGAGAERVLAGDEPAAEQELERLARGDRAAGEVYLVGAGPGDPDLLTFRAQRLMQQAEVVLYDRLVPQAILDRVRRDAERIFVGKGPSRHEMSQEEINVLLVKLAKQGRRVLRLKGGDPFIFGRGGEEIDSLARENIPFQVVPGITAASGCAAYAGIPLTHRECAQSVVFVTGHARQDGTLNLHWDQLARRDQTVVFYMGRGSLPVLCESLVRHGLPGEWPAALVEEGTTPSQRVITGTLATLPDLVVRADVRGASLVIVGEVVRLRDRLGWFEP